MNIIFQNHHPSYSVNCICKIHHSYVPVHGDVSPPHSRTRSHKHLWSAAKCDRTCTLGALCMMSFRPNLWAPTYILNCDETLNECMRARFAFCVLLLCSAFPPLCTCACVLWICEPMRHCAIPNSSSFFGRLPPRLALAGKTTGGEL